MEKSNKTKALMAASFAGLMVVAGMAGAPTASAADDACYGVNKCKGTGACGGKGHSCAGQNACEGQGWLHIENETCLKIKGGRLTADAE